VDREEVQRTNRALVKAAKGYRALQSAKLAELGLHPGQDVLLWWVAQEPAGVTVSGLAEKMGVEPPTVTRSLDRLEEGEYFTRERNATDKRTVVIRPTRKGRALVSHIDKVWEELAAAATTGLSDRERHTLVALLERVRENLPGSSEFLAAD